MYEIEKGIAAPNWKGNGRSPIYPFAQMAVGDSFLVPVMDGQTAYKVQRAVRSCASAYGSRHGMKFRTATTDQGIRVWRVEAGK